MLEAYIDSPVFLCPLRVKMGCDWSSVKTQILLSFPPVATSPRGYVSLGAMMHTQDTKLEWPDMLCISVKPLSGLSREGGKKSKDTLSSPLLCGDKWCAYKCKESQKIS